MEILYDEATTTDEYVSEYKENAGRVSAKLDALIKKANDDIFFEAEGLKNEFAVAVGLLCFKYGFKTAIQLMRE